MSSVFKPINSTPQIRLPVILIVEDEPEIGNVYVCLLKNRYKIHLSLSGEHALNQLHRDKDIDLILLDFRLPDMSGVEVLKRIKKIRPSVPVIFITAYGSEDVAIKAFTSGAKDYLKKPFSSSELTAKIEFCLALKPSGGDSSPRRTVILPPPGLPADQSVHSRNPNIYKIQRAVKYIEDNYSANLSLAIVAGRACISNYHFSRVFKEIMGVTFKKFIVGLKMEKAKEILKNSDQTVNETASAVGYDETSHFVKMFKKLTGCTPSEYRTTQRTIDQP